MNVQKLCMNCMSEQLNSDGICMACQADNNALDNAGRHLPQRIILNGKYLVGKVIGEGGFGITYLGFDLDLEIKVAIKEFYPREFVGREPSDRTVYPYDGEAKEIVETELEKFIFEAKRLAKFRKLDGVVSVIDYFRENNTAYIVMDYIDGITLKEYAKTLSKPMDYRFLLDLMKPIFEALKTVHNEGMIHRDISPDNIMYAQEENKFYLIDFGTARNIQQGTLSVYKKAFYTPLEQESKKLKQGPWTDVYAVCATLYKCLTGKNIPTATERVTGEEIIDPKRFGINLPANILEAINKGLELRLEDRIQSVEELVELLYRDCLPDKKVQDGRPALYQRMPGVANYELPAYDPDYQKKKKQQELLELKNNLSPRRRMPTVTDYELPPYDPDYKGKKARGLLNDS